MIKAGIVGAAGYVAGELIRLLVNHPEVSIEFLYSRSKAGCSVDEVHEDLVGESHLIFSGNYHFEVDVLFLCMGHGESAPFIEKIPSGQAVVIIDLSADFRLNRGDHTFVYGLPEINKNQIKEADRIANPGCFATAIQLALMPLLYSKTFPNQINVSGITGATGAGGQLSASSHFAWRLNNISVYKAFNHQHLNEINETFRLVADKNTIPELVFIPHRGDFARGIFCSHIFKSNQSLEELKTLYEAFYKDAPFTVVTSRNPNLKQVVNTNNCLIYIEKNQDNILIVSVIDNLLKGASGQAVQNMNLRFGWDETLGLKLKASSF